MISLFETRLQVSILDGPDWLVEGLGSNGFLSIILGKLTTNCVFLKPRIISSPDLDCDDGF